MHTNDCLMLFLTGDESPNFVTILEIGASLLLRAEGLRPEDVGSPVRLVCKKVGLQTNGFITDLSPKGGAESHIIVEIGKWAKIEQ